MHTYHDFFTPSLRILLILYPFACCFHGGRPRDWKPYRNLKCSKSLAIRWVVSVRANAWLYCRFLPDHHFLRHLLWFAHTLYPFVPRFHGGWKPYTKFKCSKSLAIDWVVLLHAHVAYELHTQPIISSGYFFYFIFFTMVCSHIVSICPLVSMVENQEFGNPAQALKSCKSLAIHWAVLEHVHTQLISEIASLCLAESPVPDE